jgi:hypothetical protein
VVLRLVEADNPEQIGNCGIHRRAQEMPPIPAEFPVQIEESSTMRHLGQGEVRRSGVLEM